MGYRSRSEQLTKTSEINLDYQEVVRYINVLFSLSAVTLRFIQTLLISNVCRRYKKRFHKFDKETKGFITTVDVQRVLEVSSSQVIFRLRTVATPRSYTTCLSRLQSINVHIDENALHEILNEVDLNKNGQVEIDEFLQVCCLHYSFCNASARNV